LLVGVSSKQGRISRAFVSSFFGCLAERRRLVLLGPVSTGAIMEQIDDLAFHVDLDKPLAFFMAGRRLRYRAAEDEINNLIVGSMQLSVPALALNRWRELPNCLVQQDIISHFAVPNRS
jgi:hypothetical protein